jgi:hypothetical protein
MGNAPLMNVFMAAGASIMIVIERVTTACLPLRLLHDPFLHCLDHLDHAAFRRVLLLTDPTHPHVKMWLGQCLRTALICGDVEILELLLKLEASRKDAKLPMHLCPGAVDFTVRGSRFATRNYVSRAGSVTAESLDEMTDIPIKTKAANGLNVLERGFNGVTALMLSTGCCTTRTCRIILSRGADVNAYDIFGMTALTEAIHLGHKEAVELLLAKGADPN